MIESTTLLMFFSTSILLALAPGPDNLFVMTQAAQQGRTAGLLVTMGLCTGLLAHTAAVTFGLATLFTASASAFTILKLAGAAYLLYLAVQAFRAGTDTGPLRSADHLRAFVLYRRGIIMNITNPKVSIFFLAFLPQFTDPSKGPLTLQLIQLGGGFHHCDSDYFWHDQRPGRSFWRTLPTIAICAEDTQSRCSSHLCRSGT
jgi:threonine/homoserine/homoserine lactone efflux protein